MARRIILNTGNVLELDDVIKKGSNTAADELKSSVKTTLNSWTGSESQQKGDICINRTNNVDIVNGEDKCVGVHQVNNVDGSGGVDGKGGLKVTIKLFLSDNTDEFVKAAVETVLRDLSLKCIDSVILVPPDVSDYVDVDMVAPAWKALEEAVREGQILSIGIADIGAKLLEDLYNWAQVKPSAVQVNISSCCIVPQELSAFAQQNDVQVLTHNDPNEIIDEEVVTTISSRLGVTDCKVDWIVRHRIIQQCFALVHSKGWTVALSCSE